MRIAIIGSGVSGLTSAYLLSPHHEITVFEKDNRIGGHAHTINIEEYGNEIAVDNGFMVFNPERYPNFIKILEHLNIETDVTKMSFGVTIPGEISYNSDLPNGIFAIRLNLINLRYLRFLKENIRFRKLAKRTLKNNALTNVTLKDFLDKNKLSRDFANWSLYPMLAAIWSIKDASKAGDFPVMTTLQFLDNHRLLSNVGPKWRTVSGGSIQYVKQMRKYIESHGGLIRLNSSIENITRSKDSVAITSKGERQEFDYVIFATHANTTASLLSDITLGEKGALNKFSYSRNTTVLHKDSRMVPSNKRLLAAWNYTVINSNSSPPTAVFTYCMNILQHISQTTPVYVTLNPHLDINKNMVYHTEEYEHPVYNLDTLDGQEQIIKLQGKRRTYYTGAHLGYGFHEDGVASAIEVAKLLGVVPIWEN